MNFIEGISLNHLLKKNNDTRLLKPDISDNDIEFLYKQFAYMLLQLFKLDFNRLGSLLSLKTRFSMPIRPLTFKVHDILQTGGVNTFGIPRRFSHVPQDFRFITLRY
jgi:hypothetical protein